MVRKVIPLGNLVSLAVLATALSRLDLLGRFLQRPIIATASVVAITAMTNRLFITHVLQRHIVNRCAVVCFVGWLIGQVLRDWVWLTGILFYIPSLPAFLGMASVAVWNLAAQQRRTGTLFLIGSICAAAVVLQVDSHFLWQPTANNVSPIAQTQVNAHAQPQYTLVHWNAFDGRIHWQGAQSDLLRYNADIYAFSESPSRQNVVGFAVACAAQVGEPYYAARHRTISVVARGTISAWENVVDTTKMEAHTFQWDVDGQSLRVLCIDLASSILVTRGPLLRQVNEIIRKSAPDLVVGDFNAPRRSIELGRIPKGYRHAYDECGEGLSYTWPVPFPCYSIDQCIIGPRVAVRKYELETLWSDHRAQKLTFAISEP